MSEQTEAAAREAVWAAINAWATEYQKGPAIGSEEAHKEWVLKCVALAGFIDDALDAYRTAILGEQAALVAQLTEALRVIREGDPICYVSWMNRQGYRTSPVRDYKGLYSGPQMIADVALAAADAQKSADGA